MVQLFYSTHISVDIAHYNIIHAKIGKGGIKSRLMAHATYGRSMLALASAPSDQSLC